MYLIEDDPDPSLVASDPRLFDEASVLLLLFVLEPRDEPGTIPRDALANGLWKQNILPRILSLISSNDTFLLFLQDLSQNSFPSSSHFLPTSSIVENTLELALSRNHREYPLTEPLPFERFERVRNRREEHARRTTTTTTTTVGLASSLNGYL